MTSDVKLPNPALIAARNHLPDLVLAVLAHRISPRIDINERGPDGATCIGHLAQNSYGGSGASLINTSAVKALIEHGALVETFEPDFRARDDWNRITASYDHPAEHLALICLRSAVGPWEPIFEKIGTSRLRVLSEEYPLIHEALSQSNRAATEALLDAGADPNRYDAKKGLPLVCCQSPSAFSMMISRGAIMTACDPVGRTALQLVSANTESREILAMASAAAEAEAKGLVASFKEGQTIKGRASNDVAGPLLASLFDAVDAKNYDRVDQLWHSLDLGRHKPRMMSARDARGRNLLQAAIQSHAFPLARKMLRLGMSPDVLDSSGTTAFTALLTLMYDKSERDKKGKRRTKFCAEVMDKVNWGSRGPDGSTLYERLFAIEFETQNNVNAEDLRRRSAASLPNWLTLEGVPPSCLLARVLRVNAKFRRSSYNSMGYAQEEHEPFANILTFQLQRPEFGREQALSVLHALFGEGSEEWTRYAQGGLRRMAHVIETNFGRFKDLGVDPEQIAWPQSLAVSFPTLHAAVEAWRLAGTTATVLSRPRVSRL